MVPLASEIRMVHQREAMRSLTFDLISGKQSEAGIAPEQIDRILAENPSPDKLIRFLLQKYWPEVKISDKLIQLFYGYYQIHGSISLSR